MKVLETRKNQFSEEIATHYLDVEGGRPVETWLACESASALGLGTCRCVSHPVWETERISVTEFLSLGGSIEDLPNSVFSAEHPSPRRLVLQRTGFRTLRELAGWLNTCYRLGINPLPKLREKLPEIEIRYCSGTWSDTRGLDLDRPDWPGDYDRPQMLVVSVMGPDDYDPIGVEIRN